MAAATASISIGGKRVDLNGEIPDAAAELIIKQITELLITEPEQAPA